MHSSRTRTNPPKDPTLEELRTYAAIVETGSLASASRRLGLSPNVVSRRLSTLERRLGCRLVHRTTRRLAVTDEGRLYHAHCVRILEELDLAKREIAGADGLRGTLRLAIHPGLVSRRLMDGFRQLMRRAPALHLSIGVSSAFLDPIELGLDLSVFVGHPAASSLVAVPIGDLVWALAASPAYIREHGQPGSPDELIEHQCLRVVRRPIEKQWVLTRGPGPPVHAPLGGRIELSEVASLNEAMLAGLGIGVALRPVIDAAAARGELLHVLPEWRWAATPAFAMLPRGRARLPGIRAILDLLRASLAPTV